MTKPENMRDNDELLLLLPWYATGKLTAEDTARVEMALVSDHFLQKQLALIEDELAADRQDNDSISLPRSLTADAMLMKVGAVQPTGVSLWSRLQEGAASLWTGPARLVTAAALVLIVGQFLVMGGLIMQNREARFHLASGQVKQANVVALVRFADAATMKDISAVLARGGFQIVDGPRADGFYSLGLASGEKPLSGDERQQALVRLKAMSGIVVLALPSN